MIYWIGAVELNAAKIGYTKNAAESRLRSLQTGNPYVLSVLATLRGNEIDERMIHSYLDKHRLAGEWFKLTPAMRMYGLLRAALAAQDELDDRYSEVAQGHHVDAWAHIRHEFGEEPLDLFDDYVTRSGSNGWMGRAAA